MQSIHAVLDREYLEEFPDHSYLDKYRQLLCEVPADGIDIISKQLHNSLLVFYCKCGCHSFLVYPMNSIELPSLEKTGLYCEIAYRTNYNKELNVMLFTNERGILSQVTVFFEAGNTRVVPDDLKVTGIEGIW